MTTTEEQAQKILELPDIITVRDLATQMEASPIDVIKVLMANGILANINQPLDFDTAAIVVSEMGFEARSPQEAVTIEAPEAEEAAAEGPKVVSPAQAPTKELYQAEDPKQLKPRPPVVAVLGHVDHGKTSLLDKIRQANVVAGEAGGITQHIGAHQIEKGERKLTFLDTPGHEAFTAMRARGAQATDIAILVVAADDGVMPQTVEAIDHIRAAQVPMVVAVNKIDRPSANPDRAKQQLMEHGVTIEEYGGDIPCVEVSAKTGDGIDDLVDTLLLVADVAEFKANPDRAAQGVVIEAELDRSRGVATTLLIQNGTLETGVAIVVGSQWGRIRAMFDHAGKRVRQAPPSTPVVVLGLSQLPQPGDRFEAHADDREARAVAAERAEKTHVQRQRPKLVTLEDVYSQIQAGQVKELNVVLKADVQGSVEPVRASLERLGAETVRMRIIRSSTGDISESDIMLAVASEAIVLGFNVDSDNAARALAEREGVDIRHYSVIYKLVEDMEKALKGLLEPKYELRKIGQAEVRATFDIGRRGRIAGLYLTDGKATNRSIVLVLRDGQQLHEGPVGSLRRFKDDVKEVAQGYECGLGIEGFGGVEEGDRLEFYVRERVE